MTDEDKDRLYAEFDRYKLEVMSRGAIVEWRADRCRYLGERVEFRSGCRSGMACRHECSKGLDAIPMRSCQTCPSYKALPRASPASPVPWVGDASDYVSEETTVSSITWQYGVTTVPARVRDGTVIKTLESLARAGFDKPRLFIDGGLREIASLTGVDRYDVTIRTYPVLTAGNWVLALYELWARNALADRYAIFQDDLVACAGLREYLETCPYPEKGYLNLYTVPMNQRLAPLNENKGTIDGWFLSNQMGKGALALVFDGPAVRNLLGQEYLVDRFLTRDPDPYMRARLVAEGKSNEEAEALSRRCDRRIDGGIVDAMKRRGWQEWCHSPSLVDHTGDDSTMGNRHRVGGNGYGRSESFLGEGWDARTLIGRTAV